MNLFVQILAGLGIALVGFQIGSTVEYYKKYNLYDLEKDKTTELINTLHGLVTNLLYHVKDALRLNNTPPAAPTNA